jgi:hypothetical protein
MRRAPSHLASLVLLTAAFAHSQTPQQTPLFEASSVEVVSDLSIVEPWRCDQNGVPYTMALDSSNNPTRVVRLSSSGSIEQVYSIAAMGNQYTILDYAPDTDGGLIAIAVRPVSLKDGPTNSSVPSTVLVHIDHDGNYDRSINLAIGDLTPLKAGVFSGGNLLVVGTRPRAFPINAGHLSWYAGIFRRDGSLVKEIRTDLSSLSADETDPSMPTGASIARTGPEWQDLASGLQFLPSAGDHIYIALETHMELPSFGHVSQLLDLNSNGTFAVMPLPGPQNSELFSVSAGPDSIFGVWGTRAGAIDDLRRYPLTGTAHSISRLKVLGRPLCSTKGALLVLRPDGHGGRSLITYTLPMEPSF